MAKVNVFDQEKINNDEQSLYSESPLVYNALSLTEKEELREDQELKLPELEFDTSDHLTPESRLHSSDSNEKSLSTIFSQPQVLESGVAGSQYRRTSTVRRCGRLSEY